MDIKQIQQAMKEMNSLNIHGKDYTMVAQRIEAFRKHVGAAFSIHSEILQNDSKTVLIKASIVDQDGRVVATGLAEEFRDASKLNKTSAIENCETSAWGRALACLGLHGGKMASVEEIAIAKNKEQILEAREEVQEQEHDAAVRAERNGSTDPNNQLEDIPFPPPSEDTETADRWQQFTETMKQKIKECTATWQISNLAQENASDIAILKQNRPNLQAELLAFSKVRWEQLNDGAR